jgi:hypothetical protein
VTARLLLARAQCTAPAHVDAAIVDHLDGENVRKSCVVLTGDIAFDEIAAITNFDKV